MTARRYWSDAENAKLIELRDAHRLDWRSIAEELPGRGANACQGQYYAEMRRRKSGLKRVLKIGEHRPTRRVDRPAVDAAAKPPAGPVALAPAVRMPLLDGLRERAELHLRIAERGLTAAFFGDPPPGRSALDERTRAAGAGAQRPSGGEVSDG